MNFNVHAGPVAYLEAQSLTPGVTFNSPNLSSSFAFAGSPSSTLISIKHKLFKGIPQGNYSKALQFCLTNIANPAQGQQILVFRWYVFGPNDEPYLACTDTLLFDCASCVTPPCDSCCADSLTFAALVNQGFTVVNQGCSVTVTAPQFHSCYSFTTPPVLDGGIAPQVITDPSGSWTFNFTQSGVHQICVTVFDECQSKQMCTTVRVGGIDTKISFCENDVIQNGDFTEGVEAGHLAGGPRKPWTPVIPADGRGFLFEVDSSGSSDAGHLILNGGKGSFAAVWQEVNLIPNLFTTIEFDYRNYLGKSSPAGTVLEFRLEPDSISGGPSQILYRHPISDTSAAWTNVLVSVKASPNPDFKYLFICVQNDDDELQSAVGIDNLSMCTNSISDTKQLSALKPIRIFPNPNPGSFNVELPQPATTGMTLRVTDLAGRLVWEKPTQTANIQQTVQAENLSGGMYLLQLVEKGRVVGVEKFVKQ